MVKKVLLFFTVLLLSACTDEIPQQPTIQKNEVQQSDKKINATYQQGNENLQALDVMKEALERRQKIDSLQGHMLLEDYVEVDYTAGLSTMLLSSTVDMQATNTPYETLYLMNTRQELNGDISDNATYVYLNEEEGQIYDIEKNEWEQLPKETINNFHNLAREDLDVTRHLEEMLQNAEQIELQEEGSFYKIVFDVARKMDKTYLHNKSPITQGIWQYIDPSNIDMQSINYTEAMYEMNINKETFDVEALNIFVKVDGLTVNGEAVKHSASNQSQFSSFNELQQIDLPEGVYQQMNPSTN